MKELMGYQKKYLRGLAHSMKPLVQIGQGGLTDKVIKAIDEALNTHELVKIKLNEHKEYKKELFAKVEQGTGCELAGIIGHTAILFRQNSDPEKQKINIPER